MKLYRSLLARTPEHNAGRRSLIACLVHVGDYRAALGQARIGIAYGHEVSSFQRFARIADSALTTAAPAGSVLLPPLADSLRSQ